MAISLHSVAVLWIASISPAASASLSLPVVSVNRSAKTDPFHVESAEAGRPPRSKIDREAGYVVVRKMTIDALNERTHRYRGFLLGGHDLPPNNAINTFLKSISASFANPVENFLHEWRALRGTQEIICR